MAVWSDFGTGAGPDREELRYWRRVVPALGVLVLLGAVARSALTLADGGALLEAVLDLLLVGSLGAVILYIGVWLPNTPIPKAFYSRIVGWVAGGVVVMGVVLGLRVLHPGVTVESTFGTQAVFLAIGSIAGLGIGVNEAQALATARTVEAQNEELTRAERRLEEAVTRLEASNERLEQFAYAASHDLQEPLRMVTSYLRLLQNRCGEDLDDEGEEFLEYAVDGADRMREMIDGLLAYSRVDTRGDPFEPVDLGAVLEAVREDLRFKIEEADGEVTADALPTVEGDACQLRQVLQNLLANAVEYSGDDPPRVHVSATRADDRWVVSVEDDGVGVDPEDGERVFDLFQRLHSTAEQPGSGLGLALCERIVERHGGDIWVDSEPGEGATFRFTLPAA